jgi:hypothetical protein
MLREILIVIGLAWALGKGAAIASYPERCGGSGGRCAVAAEP